MPPVEFEIAGADRLEEIVALNERIFRKMYNSTPYDLRTYKVKLSGKEPLIITARDDCRIVGDAISYEKEDSLHLWILGVEETHRKMGVGSRLLDETENEAMERGRYRVSAKVYNVSPEMQRLLIGRGYYVVGVDVNLTSPNQTAVHFVKDL